MNDIFDNTSDILHNKPTFKVMKTREFERWYQDLKDTKTKERILARLFMLEYGHFGDTKRLSTLVSELKFSSGSGIRIYYTRYGSRIIILLCGGDKRTQSRDIIHAEQLAKELYDGTDSI